MFTNLAVRAQTSMQRREGQGMTEYAVILVGLVFVVGLVFFFAGGKISTWMTDHFTSWFS